MIVEFNRLINKPINYLDFDNNITLISIKYFSDNDIIEIFSNWEVTRMTSKRIYYQLTFDDLEYLS